MNLLIENQILSPLNVYSLYLASDKIYIEKYDNYNKRTYRNRFIITSPNGPLMISIPLKKGRNHKYFKDIEISYDTKWVNELKTTLKTCYGSSAFFNYYFDDIMTIFTGQHRYLFELNNLLRKYLFEILDIETIVLYTSSYEKNVPEYFDARDLFKPAKDYKVTIQDKHYPYPTVFDYKSHRILNPSIIDLVFNMGKYSIEVLESQKITLQNETK